MRHAVEIVRRVPGGLSSTDITRLVAATLAAVGRRSAHAVSVTFVGDLAMRSLNRRTRGKDQTTDVLSFPAGERTGPRFPLPAGQSEPFGDVVICLPEARRQAGARALPVRIVAAELLIHGLLHCAGYDHAKRAAAGRMFRLQDRLLVRVMKKT